MRKKVILVTIVLATIMSEITSMQSIIRALIASGGILAVVVEFSLTKKLLVI